MTITQKLPKLSKADERDSYETATLRDDNTCQRCHRNCGPIARDHRQNRCSGNTVVSNLQCLGLRCHIWKTEHPKAALAEGWAVPSFADPTLWPARRYIRDCYGVVRPVVGALWGCRRGHTDHGFAGSEAYGRGDLMRANIRLSTLVDGANIGSLNVKNGRIIAGNSEGPVRANVRAFRPLHHLSEQLEQTS